MRSSGVNVTERVEHRKCGAMVRIQFPTFVGGRPCTFKGDVDVFADPECADAWWECPHCNTMHDVSQEIFS